MVQCRRTICRIVALISRAHINEGSFQRKHGCKQSGQTVQISVIPDGSETWAVWKQNLTKICIKCTSRLGCLVAYSAEPHRLPRYEWWGETVRCVAPIVRCNHCATFTRSSRPRRVTLTFWPSSLQCTRTLLPFQAQRSLFKSDFSFIRARQQLFQIMATPLPMDPTFQSIVASFRSRLTKAELDDFRFCSLKDVQQTIIDIQARQDKRRETRNLSRILGFLEAMTQFGTVVEVFLNTSEILAFVWGPLKFLLLV
jgi:hypothetical protein